jgi:hypothetical protein
MVVVAFGTGIPNRLSIITLFECFRCLDLRIKDLLLYVEIVLNWLILEKYSEDQTFVILLDKQLSLEAFFEQT